MGIYGDTLWLCQQCAIENGHRKFLSFPMNSMVDLSIVFCGQFTRRWLWGDTQLMEDAHHGWCIYNGKFIYRMDPPPVM